MKDLNENQLKFDEVTGLIPAVVQDYQTKAVLMLGYMTKDTLRATIKRKKVVFWSRSRLKEWEKGETSGNTLVVVSIQADCDRDTLLVLAKPLGPTCHTGDYSCFGTDKPIETDFLHRLYGLILQRAKDRPPNSYTTQLFTEGLPKILEKIEEEADEVIKAATVETRQRVVEETADLLYHLLVMLVQQGVSWESVIDELERRYKKHQRQTN